MPELPDVEVYKQFLDQKALRRRIVNTRVQEPDLVKSPLKKLQRGLNKRALATSCRHGKWLFAHVDDGPWLVLHFGMTGALKYYQGDDRPPRHAVLTLDFEDDGHLSYVDRRKLGALDLTDDPAEFIAHHELGPDALAIDWDTFKEVLAARRGGIKSAFMDQHVIAGLGNVYTDEVLFQADIHPLTAIAELDAKRRKRLYDVMRKVLTTAIARHAQRSRMPRDYLLPQRRDGAACPRCGGTILRISVNGRSTYYCFRHQPEPA